jgi:hypothetical protein
MNPDQKPQPKEPTIGEELITAIAHFPRTIAEWTVGLLIVLLTESVVITFALAAVAVGFAADSILIGVASFGVLYSLARMVDMFCRVIAQSAGRVSQAMYQTAQQPPLTAEEAVWHQPVLIQPDEDLI